MTLQTIDTRPRFTNTYTRAVPSAYKPENAPERRPDWRPEPWIPARPGAEDHKQYKSLGF